MEQRHPGDVLRVEEGLLGELRGSPAGRAIGPGDADYDAARVCFNALVDRRPIAPNESSYEITPAGEGTFSRLDIDLASDWSERRHHLAGAVGAPLLSSALGQGWFERLPGTRALRLTATGRTALNEPLGLTF